MSYPGSEATYAEEEGEVHIVHKDRLDEYVKECLHHYFSCKSLFVPRWIQMMIPTSISAMGAMTKRPLFW